MLFTAPLAADFDLLLKVGRPPVPTQEVELDAGELDEDYFQGDELDLNALLREQILLTLPLKPLCREECPGALPAMRGQSEPGAVLLHRPEIAYVLCRFGKIKK